MNVGRNILGFGIATEKNGSRFIAARLGPGVGRAGPARRDHGDPGDDVPHDGPDQPRHALRPAHAAALLPPEGGGPAAVHQGAHPAEARRDGEGGGRSRGGRGQRRN